MARAKNSMQKKRGRNAKEEERVLYLAEFMPMQSKQTHQAKPTRHN